MIPHYQVARNTLLWLFAAQFLVLLPHVKHVPVWIIVLMIVCAIWRVQVYRGHWNFPSKALKTGIAISSCVGLVFSFPTFFGLEALVSVLFAAYGLKLIEMHSKRDALIVLYLSFFLVMTSFLFDQGILLAVFNTLVVMIIVTALSGLYQHAGYMQPLRSFRLAAVMVCQALPLMVAMFILLPRFPSFWNIPLQKNTPKTGMSDSMSPGDFSRLTQSNETVMRVSFVGNSPRQDDLYWRGLILNWFDGRRWQVQDLLFQKPHYYAIAYEPGEDARIFLDQISQFGLTETGRPFSYDVILEETQDQWLYVLENSIPDTPGIWVTHEHLFLKHGPANSRFQYRARSYPEVVDSQPIPRWLLSSYLQIPEGFNPRSRQQALTWMRETGSPQAYVDRLLQWYHQDFYYTLEPPVLGRHSVDEFLFETRKGFCEHFASSFVFMLRAAGIPSRVVVGYQGGEYNPYENYWQIRQYDAHAWAEVWFEGRGWVRYDPTFAVAPQRILDGFRGAFAANQAGLPLLSLDSYRHFPFVNTLRLYWDSLNYNWTKFVLGYDPKQQFELMTQLFGEYSVVRIGLFLMGFFACFLALMYGLLLWQERDRTPDPVLRFYRHYCRKLKRKGYVLQPGETPCQFLKRVAQADPQYAHLSAASDLLYIYWYQQGGEGAVTLPAIKQAFAS